MRLVAALAPLLALLTSSTLSGTTGWSRPVGEPPEPVAPAPENPPGTSPESPGEAATPEVVPPPETPAAVPTELELKQQKARALVKRGQELAQQRFHSEALAAFRAALNAWPAYPLAQYELALTLVETKDLTGAEANLRAALALAPDFARGHQALGEVLRRQAKLEEARSSYLEAVRLAPDDTVTWYGLAAVLKAQKSEAEALWALESLLAVSGQNPDAPVAVEARKEAAALIARGVTAKAIENAPAVAEPEPEPAPKEPEVAVAEPAAASDKTPGKMGHHAGDKAFAERRYLEALRLYREEWDAMVAPEVAPEANAAEPAGADEPAAEAKATDAADGPEKAPAAEAKADKKAADETSPGANPDATRTTTTGVAAAPERPGDPELAYRIGATYAVMNDLKPAITWWMKALALAPERELIARHLGLVLKRVRTGDAGPTSPSEAMRIERAKALLRAGDAASALMLVAQREEVGAGHLEAEARMRLGDFARARQIFEELLASDPEDRIANAGLGEALFRLGEEELARKAINAWMGDERSRPETFIVLRRGELEARLLAPHEPED